MPATDQRRLDYIELEGYKTIRRLPRFHLSRGLNVLIGANGAGKSNFIRFFELLGRMMQRDPGLQDYVSSKGRADALLFRGVKTTPELRAHLWFGANEYQFALKAAADRSVFFSEETAPFAGPYFGPSKNDQGVGHTESRLVQKQNPNSSEQWTVETIRDWVVYHFHDTSSTARVMGPCNTVDGEKLQGDAGNLAAFLWRLQRCQPEHYARMVKTVRLVAPFFGDFVLQEVAPGQTQLLWRERYGDQVLYAHQMSDGSLRFICLAALLLQPNPPATVIIDEPELGLHPFAIEVLAGLLREASACCQIIVSTQSRPLVDEFNPEDLIVVDRKDGESSFRRLAAGELAPWLDEYSLGEMWSKNVFGGRPQP